MQAFMRTQIGFFELAGDNHWVELDFIIEYTYNQWDTDSDMDRTVDYIHDRIRDCIAEGTENLTKVVIMTNNYDETLDYPDGVDVDKTYRAVQEFCESTETVSLLTHQRLKKSL